MLHSVALIHLPKVGTEDHANLPLPLGLGVLRQLHSCAIGEEARPAGFFRHRVRSRHQWLGRRDCVGNGHHERYVKTLETIP